MGERQIEMEHKCWMIEERIKWGERDRITDREREREMRTEDLEYASLRHEA